jgi:hypothetical protein
MRFEKKILNILTTTITNTTITTTTTTTITTTAAVTSTISIIANSKLIGAVIIVHTIIEFSIYILLFLLSL